MKTISYNRSPILSGSELTEEQKNEVLDNYSFEKSDLLDNSYVLYKNKDETQVLPLDMFVTCEGIWNGIYSTSAFSGYFIKISNCGSMALVASKYC